MGTWDVGPFDNHAACEVLAEIRDGSFDLDTFKKSCVDSPIDVDDAEAVIALGALATSPADKLPAGVSVDSVKALRTPQTRAWLRKKINTAMEPNKSPIYALWETTGELDLWLRTTRAVLP
ncbi:DUF4259 domain-containing protein [Corynebacterium guaraldiae]|uniref:DUF4259 domain-containing protein n=1 Tax=Corynebacterium guaraldiae TaxID=3051103 RepID=UPI001177CE65|nr:DUF4259 domain-containing protein [Corynebacterium guaraldiae]TRX32830.1 DUF4259 domain-containing protein [Corynebacterium guaraldiae]TRX41115.1 DUF4259 domain-containing protein [Corynebacterium guaraldiae]